MNLPGKFSVSLLLIMTVISFFSKNSFAGDSTHLSFEKQNKLHKYISFSFGMGINYSNNPSLLKFIELDVPNYTYTLNSNKVTEFSTGIQFFLGNEFQIKKNFSIKSEYSYFIKSIDIPTNSNYQYSYVTHQPMIIFNYIFSQQNSYIKFGLGTGYFFSNFTRKERNLESNYSSSGVGVKFEGIFDAQIGKSSAIYLSGFLMNTFMSDLKNSNDNYLLNLNNEKVNLNSFGVGLRLGLEIYVF